MNDRDKKEAQTPDMSGISRRGFLKATTAGAVGSTVLAAMPALAATNTQSEELPNAKPIAPVSAPAKWDKEADVVVIGTGGAGLAATVRASEKGLSVITIEKLQGPGGSTKESACFICFGGSRYQNAAKFAIPKFPFDPEAVVQMVTPMYQFTADTNLLRMLVKKGPECIDWMGDNGVDWAFDPGFGPIAHVWKGACDGGFYPRGTKLVVDHMFKVAQQKGGQFLFETSAVALVKDKGQIVGVKARNLQREEIYIHAKKGVILASGGFGVNRDMQKRYTPSAYAGAASAFVMPSDTGECTRMGIGAGADMAGLDSFVCFDGSIDAFAMGKGPFHHYLYSGDIQLTRQPWLSIDIAGNRYPYLSSESPAGLSGEAAWQMSRVGHRGYVIFDSDYENNIWKYKQGGCRRPITPDMPNITRMPEWLAPHDWRDAVKASVEKGAIKKADSIEELAKQLGFELPVLAKAVKRWNETCASGKDTEFNFPPEWLVPVLKGPFYGARIGGQIESIKCGLRVNTSMQVLTGTGEAIPGLYAAFHTAGGAVGESCYSGGMAGGSVLGSNGLSWTSGFIAAETVCGMKV
jgi:succinate dehydrogenase/fumarate reductase flavoprotein subunit